MTKEQLKQNAAAMLAVAAGKPIQCRNPHYPDLAWSDLRPENASWQFELNEYRPAPEPVSRPWNRETIPTLPFEVRDKASGHRHSVTYATTGRIGISGYSPASWIAFDWLFEHFTMADGAICGTTEEPK